MARPAFWYFFRDDDPADPAVAETSPEKGFLKERVLIMLFTRISVSSFGTDRIDWSTWENLKVYWCETGDTTNH